MTVFLPLRGPNTRNLSPKGVRGGGWQDPAYTGIQPWGMSKDGSDGWVGMRLDHHIVVDCDCACPKVNGEKPAVCQTPKAAIEAADAWLKHIDQHDKHTWSRKTPHGFHFIYRRTPDTYGITSCKLTAVHPRIDFKVGNGQQIVFLAPGYEDRTSDDAIAPFDPAWMPAVTEQARAIDDWSEMPDGIGDNAMISFAGKFREWGMDVPTIERVLQQINHITMTENPMPTTSIRRIARSSGRWDPDEPQIIECPKCGTELETR